MHDGPLPDRRTSVGGTIAVLAVTAAACSAGAATQGSADALAKIKAKGTIVIATDASYAPNEFMDKGRIVGFDVDMGTAIARELGVRADFRNVRFDDILPALQGGKYDISLSSFTDTRRRERNVDFVTYITAGTSLMVKKGNPLKLSPDGVSLCGRRIAVQKGTTQADEITPASAADPGRGARVGQCKKAGRPAPKRIAVNDEDAADTALREGRADAVLADSPVAGYAVKESGHRFEVVGGTYETAPYGIALPKNQTKLRNAILKAVEDLMTDGSYKMFADIWGVDDGRIVTPRINGAIN